MRRFKMLVLCGLAVILASARETAPSETIEGYSDETARLEREWETKFKALPSPENIRENVRRLSARPHHVGSPYDKDNAEWILSKFKEWGIDAHIETFDVLFPRRHVLPAVTHQFTRKREAWALRETSPVTKPCLTTPRSARMFRATARGFSVIEVLVGIAMFGILVKTAISDINSPRIQIASTQLQVVGQLRLARMKAITSVSHYSVSFTSASQFKVYPMTYNGTIWQLAATPINTVTLPSAVSFPSALVGTGIEFNSRGMMVSPTAVTQIDLTDSFGQTRSLQAWPSGQVNAL